MKLNKADVNDLMNIPAWAAAAKADLQAAMLHDESGQIDEYLKTALEMVNRIDRCAERVLTGDNRLPF